MTKKKKLVLYATFRFCRFLTKMYTLRNCVKTWSPQTVKAPRGYNSTQQSRRFAYKTSQY